MKMTNKLLCLMLLLAVTSCNHKNKNDMSNNDPSKKNHKFVNACFSGNIRLVKKEIAKGWDPRLGGDYINEPIYTAVMNKKYEVVNILLDKGVNPNADFGVRGGNLLIAAIQNKDVKMVKLLVEHGAKVNRSIGRSPLYSAMIYSPGEIEDYIKTKDGILNKNDLKSIKNLKK